MMVVARIRSRLLGRMLIPICISQNPQQRRMIWSLPICAPATTDKMIFTNFFNGMALGLGAIESFQADGKTFTVDSTNINDLVAAMGSVPVTVGQFDAMTTTNAAYQTAWGLSSLADLSGESGGYTVNLATDSSTPSPLPGTVDVASAGHVYGGMGANHLTGDGNANSLLGGAANDTLLGGAGDDTLTGGAGDDLYEFAAGHGDDRVTDSDGSDTIAFTGTEAYNYLHFTKSTTSTNDLVVTNLRAARSDKVTIADFFSGNNTGPGAIETFQAGGKTFSVDYSKIDRLIGAMGSVPSSPGRLNPAVTDDNVFRSTWGLPRAG